MLQDFIKIICTLVSVCFEKIFIQYDLCTRDVI